MGESDQASQALSKQWEGFINELHRHQDDDREDFKGVRNDIASDRAARAIETTSIRNEIASIRTDFTKWTGEWDGTVNGVKTMLIWITIPGTIAAAAASIISLIRHW